VSGVISSSSTGARASERANGSTITSSRLRNGVQFLGRQHIQQRVSLPAFLIEIRLHGFPFSN
jgi:hypothetical protein